MMKISKISSGVLTAMLVAAPSLADDIKCSYSSITDTEFTGKIDKHKITERSVLVLDREKEMSSCHMTIDATINDRIYQGHGKFIFCRAAPHRSGPSGCSERGRTRGTQSSRGSEVW